MHPAPEAVHRTVAPPESTFHPRLFTLLRDHARPEEKFGHQVRLYGLTRVVGEGRAYDDDVICAAAYLHDLGVFTGHRPEDMERLSRWDHVAYAVEKTPALLRGIDFPESKIPAVLEAIKTHQPKDTPQTIEGVLLRDADILEQLGAVGIARTMCKVGRDTRFPTFTPAAAALQRALDTLPGAIQLPTTRAAAESRIALLRSFLEELQREAGAQLY